MKLTVSVSGCTNTAILFLIIKLTVTTVSTARDSLLVKITVDSSSMQSAQENQQWMMMLFLTVILSTVCYQGVCAARGPMRVIRSAVESLRDHGTYIICFKDHVTEEELLRFAAALSRSSDEDEIFTTEIIEELFIIKCLTAKLSSRALSWVRTVYTFLLKLSMHSLVIS